MQDRLVFFYTGDIAMVGFSTNFSGALDSYQSVFGGQSKTDKLPQTASEQAGESIDKPKKASLSSPGDLLSRIVGNKLANVGFEKPQETPSATGFFDIDAVVDTVSGYIEGVINRERDAGASDERINELASAARQGVEQGFGEAREIIGDAGIMSDELAQDIDTSEARIYDRIDQVVEPRDDETTEPTSGLSRPDNLVAGNDLNYREQSGVVQIKTNDGDTVTISLASVDYEAASYRQTQDSEQFGYTAYSGSQFSVSVDGDLDEGELTALYDFLGQVDGVAQSFFDGDLGSALDQAMNLSYDTSELASFALDFSYTEVSASTRAYQNVQDLGEETPSLANLPNIFNPIESFANRMTEMVEQASLLSDSPLGMLELLDNFILDRANAEDAKPNEKVQDFAKSLLERIVPEFFGDKPASSSPELEDGASVEEVLGETDD
ncbi:DUF5610 domain-containing protein [Litoribacillus peritrichatus]